MLNIPLSKNVEQEITECNIVLVGRIIQVQTLEKVLVLFWRV